LIVACVAAETVGGVGTGHLLQEGFEADMAIVTEATGLDVVPVSVGTIRGRIRVKGEHQHHSEHASPVESLRYVLDAFTPGYGENRAKQFLRSGETDPHSLGLPSGAIRWVHSDRKDLDRVAAYFDIMVLPDQTPDSVRRDLERLIGAIREEHPDLVAEIDMRGWEPPMSDNFIWGGRATPSNAGIVTEIARHHEAVRKAAPTIGAGRRLGAASDAALFRRAGVATVEYGPGSVGPEGDVPTWPAIDERVRGRDVVDCTRVIARAAVVLTNQRRA
jgi:acetylornithine deacetylase/succinyl-diaminopimelate desuccinylase-like protein